MRHATATVRLLVISLLLAGLAWVAPASAVPTQVKFHDEGICDTLSIPINVDELGEGVASIPIGPFPTGEEILTSSAPTTLDACGPLSAGNFLVTMTNLTPFDFVEVWYVGDQATTLFNFDGEADSLASALCNFAIGECLAFKIDSVGANTPLVFESNPNGIFESGETWQFILDGWSNSNGLPPHDINSIGVGSASLIPVDASSGSIIAIVPEPSTLLLVTLGSLGLGLQRRRRLGRC